MKNSIKKKILIIDDEIDLVTTLVDTLTFSGYEIDYAYDGLAGLEKLAQQKPDLILLDMMMPGMNGDAVCRKIRKDVHTKKIKIVIFSARAQEKDMAMAKAFGADDYVIKPYEIEELLEKINILLEEKNE